MALRWFEGWEQATTIMAHHARIYDTATGALTASDGASVDLNEAVNSSDAVLVTKALVGAVQNSWILGVAFRANDLIEIEDGAASYLALGNVAGEQIRFEFADVTPASTGPGRVYYNIRVMRGVTELASSIQKFQVTAVSDEDWIYFEFKATIDNTVGSFEGRFQYIRKPSLNNGGAGGTTALTWDAANTGLDTQEQGTVGADRLTISFNTGGTGDPVAMDDIYCCDSTGAKNNDYLGKVIVQGAKPSTVGGGDGDTVQWILAGGAANTQDAWDESLTAIEDDERLTSNTITDIHLAVMDQAGGSTPIFLASGVDIIGLRLDTVQHMETTGDFDIAQMWRKTTGTPAQTNSGTINVATTTYEGLSTVLEDDPNTATDWVQADIDSYQFGVRNDG